MKIGYARVSDKDSQSLDVQLATLEAEGCDKIYREKESGKSTAQRIELNRAIDQLRTGDLFIVTRLDRFARSVPDLYALLSRIRDAGGAFICLQQPGANTETPTGKLLLGILGLIAEFERDLLLERQREGIAAAKAKGVYRGRKAEIDPNTVRAAFERNNRSATATAKELGVGRASIYRILGPMAELGDPPCNTASKRSTDQCLIPRSSPSLTRSSPERRGI